MDLARPSFPNHTKCGDCTGPAQAGVPDITSLQGAVSVDGIIGGTARGRESTEKQAPNHSGARTVESGCSDGHSDPAKSPAPAIAALMIDTADVLYDASSWPRKLVRLVRRIGVEAEYEAFVDVWERNYLRDVYCGRRDYDEALQDCLLAAGLTWAQVDEVEAASRTERRDLNAKVRPLPGVVATITLLRRRGIRLVAWADADCPSEMVAERIERLGLAGQFDAVLSSFDLEAAQPSGQCYCAALSALKTPAERTAYVGHAADHLEGARSAGLRSIAFNYREGVAADIHLAAFGDLLDVLAPPSLC